MPPSGECLRRIAPAAATRSTCHGGIGGKELGLGGMESGMQLRPAESMLPLGRT